MDTIRIEVDRIDPAEALRRIRAEVEADHKRCRLGTTRRMVLYDVLAIIDRYWPNGAQP